MGLDVALILKRGGNGIRLRIEGGGRGQGKYGTEFVVGKGGSGGGNINRTG